MAMQMRHIGGHGSVPETLLVSTSLSVTEGCPMDAVVSERDTVSFTLGGGGEPAELIFDAESLRSLLELGGRVLRRMDSWPDDAGHDATVRFSAGTARR